MKKLEAIINAMFWAVMLTVSLLLCVTVYHLMLEAKTAQQVSTATQMGTIEPEYITVTADQTATELPVIELETEIIYADDQMQSVEIVPVYDVPLDADLQNYIIRLCEQYGIPPELVLAVIEKESGCNAAATGDSGNSHGLMQIQLRHHQERMARLECSDLYDPWQNVTVGIDFLAELLSQYQTAEMALMVYNAGATGAQEMWFCQGIYSNEYSRTVLEIAQRLTTNKEV